jgi:hypothetical protein
LFKYNNNEKLTLIKNKTNNGFAKAVNQGIIIAKNEFVLLLNPDSIILDKSIQLIYREILNNPLIGAIGGKIISKNQKYSATRKPTFLTGLFEFTNLKKLFPNNIFSYNFWIENNIIQNSTEVTSLCGAFILLRKKLNDKIVLFDENFFLYLEDLDFCLNIKKKGYKIVFNPNAIIRHLGGGSNNSKYNITLKYWYTSRKYLFSKHLNKFESIILNIIFTIEEKILFLYHHLTHTPNE